MSRVGRQWQCETKLLFLPRAKILFHEDSLAGGVGHPQSEARVVPLHPTRLSPARDWLGYGCAPAPDSPPSRLAWHRNAAG